MGISGSRVIARIAVTAVLAAGLAAVTTMPAAAPALADTRTSVTNYDRMAAGAPYHGYFASAWQSFIAQSDTITTVGVTVGTPNYVPDGHTITIKLCTDPSCTTTLASASPQIVNYGNTEVDLGDVGVTPGSLYYLVWYQPAAWNGQTWVTYWWSGGSSITMSDQMQAIVLGYDRGPQVDRTAVTSYNRMQPGAPYNGFFDVAWQAFTAQSNTITTLGVTVGSPGYSGSDVTVRIRLCGDPNCNTAYGETDPPIVNFGNSQGDIGDVSVTPGATYYIVYYQPAAWSGHTWITYWWAGGPTISSSDQMQAIVQGYNRTTPVPPTYYVSGTGGLGLTERSGPGLGYASTGSLLEGQQIQISCQQRSGSVVGGSDIWDQLTSGAWVSDFYTTTPVYNGFTPGIPQCSAPAPPPVNTSYRVYETGGLPLTERTGPSQAFPGVGAIPDGGAVDIACQWRSASYANGSSIWDHLGNGTWVADGYVNTPAVNQFTSGIPQCGSAPSAPSYQYPVTQGYGQSGQTPYDFNPTGLSNDPVNTLTGAFWTQATDLKVPGIGVPFALTRSYTSINANAGPLGPGWTLGYQMQLTQDDKGDLTLLTDQGAQLAFQLQSDGLFVGAPGVTATLRQTPTGYEVTRPDQTHLLFNPAGQLAAILDRNGQGLHLTDNAAGQLTSITDSAGRVIDFGYDQGTALLTSVTLPDGRAVHYSYTSGRLTTVTDPAGGITSYAYDANGRLTSITDADGHTTVTNVYGSDGRMVSQTDALGNTTTFSWDAATSTATTTDPRGAISKDVYAGNVLVARIDPLGNKTSYSYDGNLHLIAVTDGRHNTTRYRYDLAGNKVGETAPGPLSFTKTWTYDTMNDMLTAKDGRGHITRYRYDANGNLISMTSPDGQVTTYGRVPGTGLIASLTDPDGHTTRYAYDSAGNRIRQISPLGETTTWAYDRSGRMTSMVDPRGNVNGASPASYRTRYAYDALDRQVKVTDPLGHSTVTAYDAVGNKTKVTDANGHYTTYRYDAANRLTAVTDALGNLTRYSYDATGNLSVRTDPNGHRTRYGYDLADHLTRVTNPLGAITTYRYDANGNVASMTRPSGVTVAYSYDALNRRTAISYSDSTQPVTFGYDANGNRTSMTDGGGTAFASTVRYAYDAENRLKTVTRGTAVFSYSYDAAGHVTSRGYPGAGTITDRYDADGRLISVTADGLTTRFSYDANGNLVSKKLPGSNGYTETRTYDAANHIVTDRTAKGTTVLTNYAYTRDRVGNPTKVIGTDGTFRYSYDADDRVIKACFTASCSSSIAWTYDKAGNRLSQLRTGLTKVTYKYNAADELVSATGAAVTRYRYDVDGNQVAAGSRSYSYDASGHLTSTRSGTTTTTFTNDGDGNRLTSKVGGRLTSYSWDTNNPLPLLAQTQSGSGRLISRYVYGQNGPISLSVPAATYYLTGDALGSVTGVTSASGKRLVRYSYEPFGLSRPATRLAKTGLPSAEPLRFTGQSLDTFGLYDLRAREYDPSTGRFTSQDPLAAPPTDPYVANYIYTADNPLTRTDPSGQSWRQTLDTVGWVLGYVPADWPYYTGSIAGGISLGISGFDVLNNCNGQTDTAYDCGFSLGGVGAGILGVTDILDPLQAVVVNSVIWLFTPTGAD